MIKLENASDKERLKELEIAANQGQVNPDTIFKIYQQIDFNLNELINAQNIYQTLNESDKIIDISKVFIIREQRHKNGVSFLLLEDLFKKDGLSNVYSKFLSDEIKKMGIDNISERYQEIAKVKIISADKLTLGKVKYNDKILHQSKIIKFYLEGESEKKVQKDIDKIFKKLAKIKNIFIQQKI